MDTSLSELLCVDTQDNFSSNSEETVRPNDNLIHLSTRTEPENSHVVALIREETADEIGTPPENSTSHQQESISNGNHKF